MARDYILTDSEGYPYNSEFKPDFVKNGDKYHGYKTNNQEALFYYFAVAVIYEMTRKNMGSPTEPHIHPYDYAVFFLKTILKAFAFLG